MIAKSILHTDDYKITVEPAGLRKYFWDIFPYWQGTAPKFKIILKARGEVSSKHHVIVNLVYESEYKGDILVLDGFIVDNMNKDKIYPRTVKIESLLKTGDMSIKIEFEEYKGCVKEFDYPFHVTHKSWLAMVIIAGILAGIFAALGNALFSWL